MCSSSQSCSAAFWGGLLTTASSTGTLGDGAVEAAVFWELRERLQLQGIVGAAEKFTEFSRRAQKLWLCLVDEADFLQLIPNPVFWLLVGYIITAPVAADSRCSQRSRMPPFRNSTELAGYLSGLRIRALVVSPYTEKEILQIINTRLETARKQLLAQRTVPRGASQGALGTTLPPLFAPAALLLFARKAANSNGDIRMALSGLCRAIEEKLTEFQAEAAATEATGSQGSSSAFAEVPTSPVSAVSREKRRHASVEFLRSGSTSPRSVKGAPPVHAQQKQQAGGSPSTFLAPALDTEGIFFSYTSPPLAKAPRRSEGGQCVSSALRKKPPILSALETELSDVDAPPTLLSLSRSVADAGEDQHSNNNPETPGCVTEALEATAGTPQSLCSTAPSPAAAAAVSLTPAVAAKQQLRLLQKKVEEAPACSDSGPCSTCVEETLPAGLLLQHLPHSEASSRTRRDSTCSSSCVSSQSLRKGLVGLRGPRTLGGRRRGAEGAPLGASGSGPRRSACSVGGEESGGGPPSNAGGAPLSKRASEVIGVGVMSAKASAVYGHDQQQVVSRIQGLPLMQRVYLLAACRSAQKKLLDRSAAPAAVNGHGSADRKSSGAAISSQESRSSQTENIAPSNRPAVESCGVQISLEEVEVGVFLTDKEASPRVSKCRRGMLRSLFSAHSTPKQHPLVLVNLLRVMLRTSKGLEALGAQYALLAEELPHGYLLNGQMRSSCWKHAVESFEQMGLMVAAGPSGAPAGAPGGPTLLGGGGRGIRRPRASLGGFGGFGGRKSAGALNSIFSASQTKTQAWELQLSPALVEAAIKRLQPQLMGSDIEGHFSRGMEA
ncbi:AAA family protein [Cyclospora cayetanensis]|uniref:AAA family protein n=1 Tax=Cyclospora cayetanensis TaxID=88456 RepID=A0A1D3CS87_9EIME|nr:AAA family protein [Cyclospora cayetanensis]